MPFCKITIMLSPRETRPTSNTNVRLQKTYKYITLAIFTFLSLHGLHSYLLLRSCGRNVLPCRCWGTQRPRSVSLPSHPPNKRCQMDGRIPETHWDFLQSFSRHCQGYRSRNSDTPKQSVGRQLYSQGYPFNTVLDSVVVSLENPDNITRRNEKMLL